jgi:hypothetical protein
MFRSILPKIDHSIITDTGGWYAIKIVELKYETDLENHKTLEVEMAKVSEYKERVHGPLFDSVFVQKNSGKNTLERVMTDSRMIRFFVDVQNKTRLETNLQAAGVLPSLNSFEARAMRVIVSGLQKEVEIEEEGKKTKVSQNEQLFLTELIYNSVTSLLVGEKIMIEMPTFWFPAGAGVSPGPGTANHGEPNHLNTFRFAEPVFIESQQNFRVEMTFPQGVPDAVKNAYGPYHIWVVLDGYLTRDVQ